MESALNIALAILSLTSLGCLAAMLYMLRIWPKDASHFSCWVDAYNRGRNDGMEIGQRMGETNARWEISAWNTRVPVKQQAIDAMDAPVENDGDGRVTVGQWRRAPGMPAPTE